MKFRAHDTFFIRKGWLSKGMKYISIKSDIFVNQEEKPMDILGLGTNMVKALRYWLQVVGITEEPKTGKRIQTFTPLGKRILQNDRYIEEIGTLYILQYKLASNLLEATAWYFFFNEFNLSEFTRDDYVESLQKFIKMSGYNKDVALRSLNDDFQCIMNTYLPRYKANPTRTSPENIIDCPFGELGLIDILNKEKKIFKKSIPSSSTINPWVALAVIMDNTKDRKEISLNELLTSPCNIGKVYNLDSISMIDILYEIERMGEIKINRTAGLDVINIINEYNFYECIDKYYEMIREHDEEKAI